MATQVSLPAVAASPLVDPTTMAAPRYDMTHEFPPVPRRRVVLDANREQDHRGTPILGPKRKKILRGARGNAARCTPSFARRANKRSKTRMSTAQTEPHPAAPLPVPIIQQWQAPIIPQWQAPTFPQWQAPTFPPGVVTVDNNTLVSHDYFVRGVIGGLQELHVSPCT